MVYNLSFINYVGGQEGRDFDETKHLNKLKKVINLTGEWITTDLKEDMMATNINQTDEMQRMIDDLTEDIMATNVNQTDEMQDMKADLKEEIKATDENRTGERKAFHRKMQRLARKLEMWVTKVNQTVEFEGRVKLISKRKELKLLPK